MKILITGGLGFIGSNFINYILTDSEINEEIEILNLDKQTYAAQGRNIEYMGLNKDKRYNFIKGDICNKEIVDKAFSQFQPELVFSFAAESHVDRSIKSSEDFVMSNVIGAVNIFDIARKHNVKKVIQTSTDEVYGSIKEGSFNENAILNPSSPYAASKAAADLIALSYFRTYQFPIIITRSANNYGPFQFPEKLLPLFITNLIEGKKVPLMWSKENPGLNIRDWLHVKDNCRAIWFVSEKGSIGEIYNIPGENEKTNIEITRLLLKEFGYGEEMIQHIPHRLGHDFRYSISGNKLKKLGFQYRYKDFGYNLKNVINWYKEHEKWWKKLKA